MEIWKKIKDFDDYEVSNLGNIRYTKNKKIRKQVKRNNYLGVGLCKNNKKIIFTIHSLVANTFLDKQNFKYMSDENRDLIDLDKLEINHIDENKYNNCVDNLEWCTHSYNINYGTRTQKAKEKQSIVILQYDLDGKLVKKWDAMNDAIRFYNNYHICNCCKGTRKTASGYIWKYEK